MTDLTKDQVAELAGYPSYVELLEADRATLLGLYEKSVHERVELKRELEYLRTQTAQQVKALTTPIPAEGQTIEAMRQALRQHPRFADLYRLGDLKLFWVLEADAYSTLFAGSADQADEPYREIQQHVQPRLSDGYTAVSVSRPGYWLVKGPGPADAHSVEAQT